jgi:hypothetical protein
MAKKFDVAAVIGEKRDGKPMWKTFGAVFETEKGLSLKLDSMPIAKDFDGWFKLFEPSEGGHRAPAKPQASADEPNDSIPF